MGKILASLYIYIIHKQYCLTSYGYVIHIAVTEKTQCIGNLAHEMIYVNDLRHPEADSYSVAV